MVLEQVGRVLRQEKEVCEVSREITIRADPGEICSRSSITALR